MGVKKQERNVQQDGEKKKQPLSSAGLHALQFLLSAFPISAFQRTLAAETLTLERKVKAEG